MRSGRERIGALLMLCRALGPGRDAWAHTPLVRTLRPPAATWSRVLDLAEQLNVTEPLCAAVRPGMGRLDPEATERLRQAQLANTTRNLRLRTALVEAVVALNQRNIVPLLIKGARILASGAADGLSERSMVDLDLVIASEQMTAAGEALRGIGYEAAPGKPFLHPHEVPYVRPAALGPIELHANLGSPPIPAVIPVARAWADSAELAVASGRARALSPTHEVLHAILHSAVQDLNHAVAGLPLRHLLLLTDLVREHGDTVDWTAIARAMRGHALGALLRDHLWLAHRFAAMPLPAGQYGTGARSHEAHVILSFALSWPPDVRRNLRFAFAAEYLDSLYEHRNRPVPLAVARARHAARLASAGPRGALAETLLRRSG